MKLIAGSDLHKCFHEAGHIEVAYLHGATVVAARIDLEGNGRTSVHHKQDLSTKSPVACGGFAVEKLLHDRAQLVDHQGNPLSSIAFMSQAMENARVDKYPFYLKHPADASGFYPGSPFQPQRDGGWPPESDGPFIEYATLNMIPKLEPRMLVIEALAKELYMHGPLTQSDIEAVRMDFSD